MVICRRYGAIQRTDKPDPHTGTRIALTASAAVPQPFLKIQLIPDYRKFAKAVMIAALKKSMNSEPTSGTIMKATGAGP